MTTKIEKIQAVIDASRARLDAYSPSEGSAYTAYMNRQASAWKEQEHVDPADRMTGALEHRLDELERDLRTASNAGETGDAYVEMLAARGDSLSDDVDSFIESRKALKTTNPVNDAYNARMDRLNNAWKDQAKPAAKKAAPAQSVKRSPVGDSQATLDAAFKAKQDRMANAWKDGQQAPQATIGADLAFGI